MDFNQRRIINYEKIRTVGKGAFGTAVLYRKKSTNKLVVLKEINTADLSPDERQMTLNEVDVLSSLSHPNIIGYGGSFIENGMLMIEMEYADGGTLNQMLNNRETYIPEREILNFLQQISSAIAHMHSNNILHRDLKTANVFLSSDGCVKIGDFGISKILSTNVQAQTVLGTPYYISPEMCEGKEYGEKSDIWAMGCILYEICSLHRAFQASSLSALVNKIMQGNYKPIPSGYSKELGRLLTVLLDKNPENRPTAKEANEVWIPKIISSLGNDGFLYKNIPLGPINKKKSSTTNENDRSILYEIKSFGNDVNISPVNLPPRVKIINVAIGDNHFIAITDDSLVFTWGGGEKGQLGLGEFEIYKYHPLPVMTLLNKKIIMAGAGKDFSIFLSSDGKIWSCGDGSFGALGHNDRNNCHEPKIIDSLNNDHIKLIKCGSDHVAVLSKNNSLYTWGSGNKGQTGNGTTNDSFIPTIVKLSPKYNIRSLYLGYKASMIITIKGELLACGWNVENRLGLLKRRWFRKTKQVSLNVTSLQEVNCIHGHVVNCSIGRTHSAIYVKFSSGQTAVYITGQVKDGTHLKVSENTLLYRGPTRIHHLNNVHIKMLECGPTYTIVGTDNNCILFWGIRFGLKETDGNFFEESHNTSGVWSQSGGTTSQRSNEASTIFPATFSNFLSTSYSSEIIDKPTPLIALYSSTKQVKDGSFLTFSGIYPLRYSVLFLVKTTVPLATRSPNYSEKEEENIELSEDYDTIGPLPSWMKMDIMQSKYSWPGS